MFPTSIFKGKNRNVLGQMQFDNFSHIQQFNTSAIHNNYSIFLAGEEKGSVYVLAHPASVPAEISTHSW